MRDCPLLLEGPGQDHDNLALDPIWRIRSKVWERVDPSGELVPLAPPMRLRNTLARFWPFLRPYPVQLALIGLSVIAAPRCLLSRPGCSK